MERFTITLTEEEKHLLEIAIDELCKAYGENLRANLKTAYSELENKLMSLLPDETKQD